MLPAKNRRASGRSGRTTVNLRRIMACKCGGVLGHARVVDNLAHMAVQGAHFLGNAELAVFGYALLNITVPLQFKPHSGQLKKRAQICLASNNVEIFPCDDASMENPNQNQCSFGLKIDVNYETAVN
jgi:hypothetical protein